jgi:hypothetical protein
MPPRRWYSYGPDVTSWIEANCVLPSGEHIGRPFRLMQWQKDWINELYACDAKGNLRYRWSLLGIAAMPPTVTAGKRWTRRSRPRWLHTSPSRSAGECLQRSRGSWCWDRCPR